ARAPLSIGDLTYDYVLCAISLIRPGGIPIAAASLACVIPNPSMSTNMPLVASKATRSARPLRGLERLDCRDLFRHSVPGELQLILRLQIKPELRIDPEIAAKAQRRVSSNRTLAVNDFIDAARRHADGYSQLVLRDSETCDEVLHKNLTRVNGIPLLSGSRRVRHLRHLLLPK